MSKKKQPPKAGDSKESLMKNVVPNSSKTSVSFIFWGIIGCTLLGIGLALGQILVYNAMR